MIHFQAFESSSKREDALSAASCWAEVMLGERGPTESEQVDFDNWAWDPEHAEQYTTEVVNRVRVDEMLERSRDTLRFGLMPYTTPRYLPAPHQWARPRWAVAAVVVIIGLVAAWNGLHREHYATGIGEKLATQLLDGTSVELSPKTDLEWLGSGHCDRRVRLLRGEALFSVHSDSRCPFQVLVGRGRIEVLGTEFDVREDGFGETRVSVLAGQVRLHGPFGTLPRQVDLSAGQQGIMGSGLLHTRKLNDVSKTVAWREDKLNFDNESLPQVIDDLRRYTAIPIKIADRRLLSKHVTITELPVDKTHIRASVLALEDTLGIDVKDDGHSLILSYLP